MEERSRAHDRSGPRSIPVIKQLVKNVPGIGPKLVAWRLRYHAWRTDPVRLLGRALRATPDAMVVQIGANDGRTGDPIHQLIAAHPAWRTLFVEPVPFVFERLVATYRHRANCRFENVAVAETPGTRCFFYLPETAHAAFPDLPEWYDQLGSFNREHIVAHLGARVEPFIARAPVECVPLAALLARNNVGQIDLLHVDAEGYDWKILRQLNLNHLPPRAILFEHRHLSANEKSGAVSRLSRDYRLFDHGADLVCLHRNLKRP
jgi:FkbM family methyltransferase